MESKFSKYNAIVMSRANSAMENKMMRMMKFVYTRARDDNMRKRNNDMRKRNNDMRNRRDNMNEYMRGNSRDRESRDRHVNHNSNDAKINGVDEEYAKDIGVRSRIDKRYMKCYYITSMTRV